MARTLSVLLLLLVASGCGDDDGPRIEGTEPGDCSDGADNDADGDFDCNDTGCIGSPICDEADGGPIDAGERDAGTRDAGELEDGGICEGTLCGDTCVADVTSDADHCGGCDITCGPMQECRSSSCCASAPRALDLLFVVDDSNGMVEEQARLAAALPRLLAQLVTGDHDSDGTVDAIGVDLQMGVVSTDMGSRGFTFPTCADSDFGDDGLLLAEGNESISGCLGTYPVIQTVSGGDTSAAAMALQCVTTMGIGGCGLTQPLDAALKALTPSGSDLRFADNTTGHGDAANAGFLRDDSLVVIVMLTDRDDCSASNPDLFNPVSTEFGETALGLRCTSHPDALHPASRFVDGLGAAVGDTSRLVLGVIAGMPTDIDTDSLADILADERMDIEVADGNVVDACTDDGSSASPARRLLSTGQGLASDSAVVTGSICRDSYADFFDRLVSTIDGRLAPICDPG